MIRYGLYFSEEEGAIASSVTTFRIPVNPENYAIEYAADSERYNVLGLGEIIQPRAEKLAAISWEGIFPGDPRHPGVVTGGDFKGPQFYLEKFRRYMSGKTPIWFMANRYLEDGTPLFDTMAQVIVEKFEVTEKGGETGDFHYKLELTEYRDFKPAVAQPQSIADTAIPETVAPAAEQQRQIPRGQLYKGCPVVINGKYFSDSYGAEPHGTASGRRGSVSRLVTDDPQRPYPVHVVGESGGALGWLRADQVEAV